MAAASRDVRGPPHRANIAAIAATGEATGCDCSTTDDGRFVWDVYLNLVESGTGDDFIAAFGDDAETIPADWNKA